MKATHSLSVASSSPITGQIPKYVQFRIGGENIQTTCIMLHSSLSLRMDGQNVCVVLCCVPKNRCEHWNGRRMRRPGKIKVSQEFRCTKFLCGCQFAPVHRSVHIAREISDQTQDGRWEENCEFRWPWNMVEEKMFVFLNRHRNWWHCLSPGAVIENIPEHIFYCVCIAMQSLACAPAHANASGFVRHTHTHGGWHRLLSLSLSGCVEYLQFSKWVRHVHS